MRPRTFHTQQWLSRSVEEVFAFFADARNLQALTPEWLDFSIVTPAPIPLHQGAIINYRLRVHGFPLRWQSEITAWEPPWRFVDEQRQGPYRLWVHAHRFASCEGGTEVIDHVRYVPRGGWLVDRLFVRRDLKRIFRCRHEKLETLFGTP